MDPHRPGLTLRTVPVAGWVLGGTLTALSLLSWVFVAGANMPMDGTLDPSALLLFTVIWAIGMVAMMFPSLIPMAYMVAVSARSDAEQQGNRTGRMIGPALFVLGYIGVWTLPGVIFFLVIAGLAALGQSVSMGLLGLVGGAVLVATGVYQFTRFKQSALMKCRSPVSFIMTRWRSGLGGALTMGGDYGLFCTRCCWVLMAGLLIVGAMSLPLMGVFAIIIFAEKIGPYGVTVSRLVGAAFIVTGIFLAFGL